MSQIDKAKVQIESDTFVRALGKIEKKSSSRDLVLYQKLKICSTVVNIDKPFIYIYQIKKKLLRVDFSLQSTGTYQELFLLIANLCTFYIFFTFQFFANLRFFI